MNTQNIKHCWAHEACHAQTHNNMGSFTNSAPVNPIFSVSSHSWNSSPPLLLLLLFFLRLGHPACLPHFSLVSGLENKPDKSFYQPALRKGQCWGVCQKEGEKKGGGGLTIPFFVLYHPAWPARGSCGRSPLVSPGRQYRGPCFAMKTFPCMGKHTLPARNDSLQSWHLSKSNLFNAGVHKSRGRVEGGVTELVKMAIQWFEILRWKWFNLCHWVRSLDH